MNVQPLHIGTAGSEPAAAAGPPVVELAGVSKRFGARAALDDVTLTVRRGEVLGIIGRSGAGKSTLIRCLNGLERPDAGEVRIEGRAISRLSERELQPMRRRIGMIFQHFNLLANSTASENVALPLKIAGIAKAERMRRAGELLDLVGLSDRGGAYPAQLSGGQKQRVGIARALAAEPALLLSDEATSALDPETTGQILELLRDINRRLGLTVALVTHEMEVVREIASRVVVLENGRVAEEGEVWRVFADPQAPITATLLRSLRPELPADLAARLTNTLGGEAVFRLDLIGDAARAPLLAELAGRFGIEARLLHGGIETIQGRPVARLFVAVSPSPAVDLAAIAAFFASRATRSDLLGHVSSSP